MEIHPVRGAARADADHLRALVVELAETIGPRSPEQPSSLAKAAVMIERECLRLGHTPLHQSLSRSAENLVVRLGGAGAPMVVGAHYDTTPSTPGADDNASGVAALLELLRMLTLEPPRSPVELVFYALEEPPYFRTEEMGSRAHARGLPEIRGMISLEMLGFYADVRGSQRLPGLVLASRYPDVGNFLLVVGRPSDRALVDEVASRMAISVRLPIYRFIGLESVPGVDFSDHQSYWAAGQTAVMITDTAFLRNRHYHREGDRPETIDYARLALAVDGVFAALAPGD